MKNFIKNLIVDDYTRWWYSKIGIENVSVRTHITFNIITMIAAVAAYEYGAHQDEIEEWYSNVSQKITRKLENLLR